MESQIKIEKNVKKWIANNYTSYEKRMILKQAKQQLRTRK